MPDRAPHTRIPHEALASLRHRLETLPARHPDRKGLVANAAALYGLSRATLYRGLRHQIWPKPLHRSDRGKPKIIATPELERYCETIAAMKLRTMNGKGRHLSTARAIQILEDHGVETPEGPVRLTPGLLSKATATAISGSGAMTTIAWRARRPPCGSRRSTATRFGIST